MLVSQIDQLLSVKIGDPKPDNGDGVIFSSDARLGYLNRAYGRLSRILTQILGENQPNFNKIKRFSLLAGTGFTYTAGVITLTSIVFKEIQELYLGFVSGGTTVFYPATFLTNDKFLSVINGKSGEHVPTASKSYYYFLINDGIVITPSTTAPVVVEIVYTPDLIDLSISPDDTDLPITKDYLDLYIQMAAQEAMNDISNQVKSELYAGDITSQITLIQNYATNKKTEKGVATNE